MRAAPLAKSQDTMRCRHAVPDPLAWGYLARGLLSPTSLEVCLATWPHDHRGATRSSRTTTAELHCTVHAQPQPRGCLLGGASLEVSPTSLEACLAMWSHARCGAAGSARSSPSLGPLACADPTPWQRLGK